MAVLTDNKVAFHLTERLRTLRQPVELIQVNLSFDETVAEAFFSVPDLLDWPHRRAVMAVAEEIGSETGCTVLCFFR